MSPRSTMLSALHDLQVGATNACTHICASNFVFAQHAYVTHITLLTFLQTCGVSMVLVAISQPQVKCIGLMLLQGGAGAGAQQCCGAQAFHGGPV
jgi:hypothetical protein